MSKPESTGSKQPGRNSSPASPATLPRPKGSKNKYAEQFWADLQAEWEIGGRAVVKRVMAEEPAKFLAIAANVLPKHDATDAFVSL